MRTNNGCLMRVKSYEMKVSAIRFSVIRNLTLGLLAILLISPTAWAAKEGGAGSGVVGRFIQVAEDNLRWLRSNAAKSGIAVDLDAFANAIEELKVDKKIDPVTRPIIYKNLERTAFYDSQKDKIFINIQRWQIEAQSPMDLSILVAHEICRKAGCEGDDYRVSSRIRIGASCIKEGCLVDELSMYRQLYFEARQFNLSSVLSTYIPDQKVDIIRSGGIESVVNADGIVRPTFRLDTGLVGAYPAVYFNRQSYFPRAYITFVAKKNHDGIFPKVFHWVSSVQPFPRSLESMPTLEEYDARGMSWVTNNLDRYTGNMRKENGENRLYQRQYLAILPSFYADSRFSIINSSEPHLVRYTFRSISDDDSKLIVRVEVCIKDEWIEHYYFHIDLARADYLSGQQ